MQSRKHWKSLKRIKDSIFFSFIFYSLILILFFSNAYAQESKKRFAKNDACILNFKDDALVPVPGGNDSFYSVDCSIVVQEKARVQCYEIRDLLINYRKLAYDSFETLTIPSGENACFKTNKFEIELESVEEIEKYKYTNEYTIFEHKRKEENFIKKAWSYIKTVPINFVKEKLGRPSTGTLIVGCRKGELEVIGHVADLALKEGRIDDKVREKFSEIDKDLENLCKTVQFDVQKERLIKDKTKSSPYLVDITIENSRDLASKVRDLNIYGISCGNSQYSYYSSCCNPEEVLYPAFDRTLKSIFDYVGLGKLRENIQRYYVGLISSVVSDDLVLTEFHNSYAFCQPNSIPAYSEDLSADPYFSVFAPEEKESLRVYRPYKNLEDIDLGNCKCVEYKDLFEKKLVLRNFVSSCDNLSGVGLRDECLQSFTKCGTDKLPTALGCVDITFNGFVNNFVFKIVLATAGIFVFFCIAYGGLIILLSKGDLKRYQQARDMITNCVLSLLFIIFSVFILRLVSSFIFGFNIFGS